MSHPRSVAVCLAGKRQLALWDPADPVGTFRLQPWTCNSWRCPKCRAKVALQDYARLAQALEAEPRWVYVVLTAPPALHRLAPAVSYRALSEAWSKRLRHRIKRSWGKPSYVQTWERHKSGVAHVNLVLRTPDLMASIEETSEPREACRRWGAWLLAEAEASGFGRIGKVRLTFDPTPGASRPLAGLASYMVKVAHTLDLDAGRPLAAELTYAEAKGQSPVEAPAGFRRLRASRGVLPPRLRAGLTGSMVRAGDTTWTSARALANQALKRIAEALECRNLLVPPAANSSPPADFPVT